MTNPIQIIFVDGPTAVGKGYFMENFVKKYKEVYPDANVQVIRAVDVVLKATAQSEERKYVTYNTPVETATSIYQGHLTLLDKLQGLSDLLKKHDLIIVDRSFLSFLIYNWMPLKRFNHATEALNGHGIDEYAIEYNKRLKGVSSLFVNISLNEHDEQAKVDTLINRAVSRQDGKPIDAPWFKYLVQNYEAPCKEFTKLFTKYIVVDSGESERILKEYFTHALPCPV